MGVEFLATGRHVIPVVRAEVAKRDQVAARARRPAI
jgi:hypothetical protein